MIRNTVVNTLSFFYALGNTPAVSLTQDLPPEQDADILLLGCGDARNILFTSFADPGRRLDVTCCDIEPAILARNILLLTLIADGKAGDDDVWAIYYHYRISPSAYKVLQDQLKLLLSYCKPPSHWDASPYGNWVSFLDQRTFERIVSLWKVWCTRDVTEAVKKTRRDELEIALKKTLEIKTKFHGDDVVALTTLRNAAPASYKAFQALPQVANHWWKTGALDTNQLKGAEPQHLNPSLLSPSNPKNSVLHYGLEPIGGFPLASAYIPLDSKSKFHMKQSSTSFVPAVTTARTCLRLWASAFREALKLGSTIRICAADALAICHTFQAANSTSGMVTANLPYDNWTSLPLELDVSAANSRPAAPVRFSVIDSSNLVDHLGALNIITAAKPLLKPHISSTLYTEVLVQGEDDQAKQLELLLCGDFKTMSVLLGMSPVELWTNATSSSEADEGLLTTSFKASKSSGKQARNRLRWKLDPNPSSPASKIASEQLAHVLSFVYGKMHRHEDVTAFMSYVTTSKPIDSLSNPYYTRAGFAAIVGLIKTNVVADWDAVLKQFFEAQEGSSTLSITRHYNEEMRVYLELCGLYAGDRKGLTPELQGPTKLPFAAWSPMPPFVAVTAQIPRRALAFLSDIAVGTVGIPVLSAAIRIPRIGVDDEVHLFSAIQVAFGTVVNTEGSIPASPDFQLTLKNEDRLCWEGHSPIVVSFFVPSVVLMRSSGTVVDVSFQTTPQSTMIFSKKLGPELRFFETTIDNSNVHITRFLPNMEGLPKLGIARHTPEETLSRRDYTASVSLQLDKHVLSSLTGRLDFTSEAAKANLANKSSIVSVHFPTPLTGEVTVGDTIHTVSFPTPVAGSKQKVRIARKSSYIEVVVPLWDPLGNDASTFMFPTSPSQVSTLSSPTSWNSQRVNLNLMPKIDLSNSKDFQWLITHASLAFSDRERKLREASMIGHSASKDTRVELKDGLYSILMQYTGVQGQKAEYFGLATAETGIHTIIMPSCLRLDLANRTVVIDAAIIPLTLDSLSDKKLVAFLESGARQGVMSIKVSDEELKSWKAIFPALVERCRTWKHKPNCEYLEKQIIPLTLEEGKTPLCSCGNGTFPPAYIQSITAELPYFKHVLKNYATRAAISPIFAVGYVESCFLQNYAVNAKGVPMTAASGPGREECRRCGRDKAQGSPTASLQTCSRCNKVKYCSKVCQRLDWATHKQKCSS